MDIEGLDGLVRDLNNSIENVNREAEKTINRIGNKLLRKVKLKSPVAEKNGGTLRRSWQFNKVSSLEGVVVNPVEYASYVEWGHRTRGGRSFVEGRYMLTKSVEEIESELDGEINIILDNLF